MLKVTLQQFHNRWPGEIVHSDFHTYALKKRSLWQGAEARASRLGCFLKEAEGPNAQTRCEQGHDGKEGVFGTVHSIRSDPPNMRHDD